MMCFCVQERGNLCMDVWCMCVCCVCVVEDPSVATACVCAHARVLFLFFELLLWDLTNVSFEARQYVCVYVHALWVWGNVSNYYCQDSYLEEGRTVLRI